MIRTFNHFEVAPGRADEAEKLLKEWASRMKGSPGFLGCHVFRAYGHDMSNDYGLMQDWHSSEDSRAFREKNKQFALPIGDSAHHHEEDEHEGPQKELFHVEFHGHYELIFHVSP